MVIWYKFYFSTSFSFLFIYFFKHDLFIYFFFFFSFLCFYIFIWQQGDLRSNWSKVIFYFLLGSNLFSVLSIKNNYLFSIIIYYLTHFTFLLLVQFYLFVITYYQVFFFFFYGTYFPLNNFELYTLCVYIKFFPSIARVIC